MDPHIARLLNFLEERKRQMTDAEYKDGLESLRVLAAAVDRRKMYEIRVMRASVRTVHANGVFAQTPVVEFTEFAHALQPETYEYILSQLRAKHALEHLHYVGRGSEGDIAALAAKIAAGPAAIVRAGPTVLATAAAHFLVSIAPAGN
uniref:Uncharacterized protein n=1 Tax=Marseillevirus LCMAC103 TaxID=2506604 RepID=A0A481YUU4_9VIRU|nr:MAG: hypothetical protein LCMAC103_04270 [Marseillevirus LCMAC103]